ncbi:hypothetical protein [Methylobacterium sp. WSM2598]|uniref:hypothetical protein n=1 Tax=Methylobacterium sp. WSM2598 TaxID=398261 RepID=UPI0012F67054|nr:hypothetical protein [Methylobacterium sp. WSM2598]
MELWRAGFGLLSREEAPCPGYKRGDGQAGAAILPSDHSYDPGDWPRAYDRAADFLERFGEEAEALGWTASLLFGVHPTRGVIRVDYCGALVLTVGGPAVSLTGTEIRFGHLAYRKKPGQPTGIPVWEFCRDPRSGYNSGYSDQVRPILEAGPLRA